MLARRGSSCRALHVPFRALRLPTCPRTRPEPALRPSRTAPGAPSLGFAPSSRRQPAASTHARGCPSPDFGPSSAFRTPSTVYATTGLAGLFHPAAAYRVRPSGDCPPPGARPAFADRPALVPLCTAPPVLTPGRPRCPRLQGLAPQTDAVVPENGKVAGTPRPSWTCPSSGCSPRAPCDPSRRFRRSNRIHLRPSPR